MATLMFDDLSFPTELYKPDGSFAQLVQDLLDFAPKVADHHVKQDKVPAKSATSTQASNAVEEVPSIPSQAWKFKQNIEESASKNWGILKDVVAAATPVLTDLAKSATPLVQEYVKYQIAQTASAPSVQINMGGESHEAKRHRAEMEAEMEALKQREQLRERELEKIRQREVAREKDLAKKELEATKEAARREAERKEAEKKKAEQKNAQGDESNQLVISDSTAAAITTGLLAVGSAGVAAFSTYKTTEAIGYTQFLAQFASLCQELRSETVPSVKAWIKERQSLQLPVAPCVKDDLKMIEDLLDWVDRLDDTQEQKRTVPGYVLTGAGAALVAAGTIFLGEAAAATTRPFGLLATGLGALWVLGNWGLRSSDAYKASYRDYARKVHKATKELDSKKHQSHVMYQLDLMMQAEERQLLGEREDGLERLEHTMEEQSFKIPIQVASRHSHAEAQLANQVEEMLAHASHVPTSQPSTQAASAVRRKREAVIE